MYPSFQGKLVSNMAEPGENQVKLFLVIFYDTEAAKFWDI